MQTSLADFIRDSAQGQRADAILRSCVHCGFCTATCPTYQLLGDERDSPRGRIWLIKQVLEGQSVTQQTQTHLDRCLTCRSCETTCPSGVEYAHLLDIGRAVVEQRVARPWSQRAQRYALLALLSRPRLFGLALAGGRAMRGLLPASLQAKLPPRFASNRQWPADQTRPTAPRMLLLEPCVQDAMNPNLNPATARVLARLGVQTLRLQRAQCCGALQHHMNQQQAARAQMLALLEQLWPWLEREPDLLLLSNASGCGVMLKDYANLLADAPQWAQRAAQVAARVRDLAEVLPGLLQAAPQLVAQLQASAKPRLAWHAPCTLQHGQRVRGVVEACLRQLGFSVHLPPDAHLCCGSAGSWSLLQPEMSQQLRSRKLQALQMGEADVIVTANIGCQAHLAAASQLPVRHWVEVLDSLLAE